MHTQYFHRIYCILLVVSQEKWVTKACSRHCQRSWKNLTIEQRKGSLLDLCKRDHDKVGIFSVKFHIQVVELHALVRYISTGKLSMQCVNSGPTFIHP